jgi:hypothetical protein
LSPTPRLQPHGCESKVLKMRQEFRFCSINSGFAIYSSQMLFSFHRQKDMVKTPSSQIRRPLLQLGVMNLALYMTVIGLEMILLKAFYESSSFATARYITHSLTTALGMPPLYIWGFSFIATGIALVFIFTDSYWVIGFIGALAAFGLLLSLAICFLHTGHIPVSHRKNPGIFGATTGFFLALEFAQIAAGTLWEHRRN